MEVVTALLLVVGGIICWMVISIPAALVAGKILERLNTREEKDSER